jgi:LPPG:FO 2-phospho-L-lactate transferase
VPCVLVALCGGVGAARLLAGLVAVYDPSGITAVVNTGDDLTLHGLHISPDIDTVLYTLAGQDNKETGWGVTGETWHVMEALGELGGEDWFRLGDRDLATHLYRTQRLSEGATLTEATAELARRRSVAVTVVPMSDDRVRTRLTLASGGSGRPDGDEVAFQHYFVRLHHDVAVRAVRYAGADDARPAPGVIEALATADRVVVCPSNPIVSIAPILAVPGILDAVTARRHEVVAVSPIVAGAALKGPADRLLVELGHESSVVGVARQYAPFCGTLVIDEADADRAGEIEGLGMRCVVAPTVMRTAADAASLGRVVIDGAG